jgi:hypothetical protein
MKRLLKKGGCSFDKEMMQKYSENEYSRIQVYWSSSPNSNNQAKRMHDRIHRPENFDDEDCFIDNKIDIFGTRQRCEFNDEEVNILLLNLVDFIRYSIYESEDATEDEDLKISNSSLLRLWHCYNSCKKRLQLRSIENDSFFFVAEAHHCR